MGVQTSFWYPVFISFEYILQNGIAGSYGSFIFHLWGISTLFFIVVLPIYIANNSVHVFFFPHILAKTYLLPFFFFFFWSHCTTFGILVSWPRIKPVPLQWKHGILTTGPPGNSLSCLLDNNHSKRCEVMSFGFDLHFSDDQQCWA